jgi:hypothetical protein
MVLINIRMYLLIIATSLRIFNWHIALAALRSGIEMKVQADEFTHAIMKVNCGSG